jgi:hypothetical protein
MRSEWPCFWGALLSTCSRSAKSQAGCGPLARLLLRTASGLRRGASSHPVFIDRRAGHASFIVIEKHLHDSERTRGAKQTTHDRRSRRPLVSRREVVMHALLVTAAEKERARKKRLATKGGHDGSSETGLRAPETALSVLFGVRIDGNAAGASSEPRGALAPTIRRDAPAGHRGRVSLFLDSCADVGDWPRRAQGQQISQSSVAAGAYCWGANPGSWRLLCNSSGRTAFCGSTFNLKG